MGTSETNRDLSDDLVFEIHLPDRDYTIPELGVGQWTGTNRRYAQLALGIAKAANSETENEASAAALIKGVALEAMNAATADRVTIELVHWVSQANILEPQAEPDPASPAYREVLYTADVLRRPDGKVVVSKRASAKDAAPPMLPPTAPKGGAGEAP